MTSDKFDSEKYILHYLSDLKASIDSLSIDKIHELILVVKRTIESGNKIFMCGNGGSAANASHSAGDWSKEMGAKTICLSDNIAAMTAWANDSDYSDIFSSQINTYYEKGDILMAYSGSGNSKNVLKAVQTFNQLGGITIGITGNYNGLGGGRLANESKISVVFDTESMERIEDLQLILNHIIKQKLKSLLSI